MSSTTTSTANPISKFHEYCQKNKITPPEERWDFQGPPNDRIWFCHVMWDGIPFSAFGDTKQDIRSRIYHGLMNYLCVPKVKKQEEQGGLTTDQLNWLKVHIKSAHMNVKSVIEEDETMVCNGLICTVMALRDAMKILGIYKEEAGDTRKEGEEEGVNKLIRASDERSNVVRTGNAIIKDVLTRTDYAVRLRWDETENRWIKEVWDEVKQGMIPYNEPVHEVKEIIWNREEPEVLKFPNKGWIQIPPGSVKFKYVGIKEEPEESKPVTCPDTTPNDPVMAVQYIKPDFDLNNNYAIKKTKDNEHWPVFQDKQQAELVIDYIIQEYKEEEPILVGYKDTNRILAIGISKVRVPNQAYPLFSIREIGDVAPYGCETKEQLLEHLTDGTYRRMLNLYKKEKGAIARICIDDDLSTDERRIINEVD